MEKLFKLNGKLQIIQGVEALTNKISYEEFFIRAIKNLRDPTKSKGIHSVFSGFNQAFRDYYGEDPVDVTQKLVKEGMIDLKPVKGGVMLYLPGEGPKSFKSDVLDIILQNNKKKIS